MAELEARRGLRDARGRYVPGSTATLVDGRRSEQLLNALAPACRAIEARVTADCGAGDEGLSETLSRLVQAFAETSVLREAVFYSMAGRPTSAKGHARRLLSAYLTLIDREQRLAQAIGLERRAPRVGSLAELLDREAKP